MFKSVPGNHNYVVSLDGKMRNLDGTECTLPVSQDNKVSIELYGKLCCVDLEWLGLMAHFEMELPKEFADKMWNISFTDANPKAKIICGKVMVFLSPIVVMRGFRLVPMYPRYAVSKNGIVFDIETSKILKNTVSDVADYVSLDIKSPDKGKYRNIMLHRLVALAWVKNTDPFNKYIINHIDGNKINRNSRNLEWVTVSENNNHAFRTGLRSDNKPCKIRDAATNEVTEHQSISTACKFMGLDKESRLFAVQYKTKNKLIGGRYEIKLKDDDSPWFYELNPIGTAAGRYHLNLTYPDGRTETHTDVRTFKKKFKIWNVVNVHHLKAKTEELYPGLTIEIVDHYIVKPIQAYKIETGEIFEAAGIRQMTRLISRDMSNVQSCLRNNETYASNGYAYRYKCDTQWNTAFTYNKRKPWCISATNPIEDVVMSFLSLTDAAKHFDVDRSVIKRCLKKHVKFNDWVFKETN